VLPIRFVVLTALLAPGAAAMDPPAGIATRAPASLDSPPPAPSEADLLELRLFWALEQALHPGPDQALEEAPAPPRPAPIPRAVSRSTRTRMRVRS